MNRGSGRDGRIRFAVVMEKLTTRLLERSKIRQRGLERIHITHKSGLHPIDDSIVSNTIKSGEVVLLD